MSWHRLSMQPKWIDNVYGDTPPTLRACRLSIVYLTNNNDLRMMLHTDQMPPEHLWPKRWDKGYNRVAIKFALWGIRTVHIKGWSANNVADVEIRGASDGQSVALTAYGAWGRITATFGHLHIDAITGYRAEDVEPCGARSPALEISMDPSRNRKAK